MTESPEGLDVVSHPLFAVAHRDKEETLSLSALAARLLTGPEIDSFPHLTPEQRGHWWRFLVRCAAKVLHEAGSGVESVDGGRALAAMFDDSLHRLAPEGAWLLYQPDPGRAGFLQPPTPDGRPPGKQNNYRESSPSLLTSTIGVKDHERKYDVARALTPEQAVYSLIEYQFGAIFGGRGNYQSQLMGSRSGAGSGTPFMGARIGESNRETFRHDVGVMLRLRHQVSRDLRGEIWALWAEPWDGKRQIGSEALDPAFIPVARMVRLAQPDGGLFQAVWFRPTDTGRVRDHTGGGVLGDPFTPLVPDPKTGNAKVRGTLRKGYDYTEIVRLLFGTEEQAGTPSPSVQALADRGELHRLDLRVVFEGTAYEQGKTGGFHRREVLLPAVGGRDVFAWLSNPAPVRRAHTAMYARVRDTKSALRGAARIVLAGTPRPRDGDASRVELPATLLEQRVDVSYLDYLFSSAARVEQDDDWIAPWINWLSERAMEAFRATLGALPSSTGRRFEREVQAEAFLRYRLAQLKVVREGNAPDEDAEPDENREPQDEEG